MSTHLYGILYHSQLAISAAPSCVPEILKVARAFNAIHGVTGILVFDGNRFLQYLEGPQEILQDLIGRISRDRRHINFSLQYAGIQMGDRQFENWSMAYSPTEDEEFLEKSTGLKGLPALKKFAERIPLVDMV